MLQSNRLLAWCGVGVFCALSEAHATNGIFLPGHGGKAIGMGGASMAMTQEAMGGVTNPATMVFTPDMIYGGAAMAWAPRSVEREGSVLGILDGKAVSAQNPLIVPEGGANWHWRDNIAIGLSTSSTGLITD
jgi:long-chain fatty acid transport protein